MAYKRFKYLNLSKTKKIRYFSNNSSSKICVVFLHGFMSNIEGEKPSALAKFCLNKKINFLTLEYSGHGKSYGKFLKSNISKWTRDVHRTINLKMKNKKLIIVGSSMGSWIAINIILKLKNKIKGFLGISSAPEFLERLFWKKFSKKIKKIILSKKIYYVENGGYSYPITKQLIFDGKKNKVFNKKIKLKIPITLFHTIKDEVVPVSFSKKILRIFPYAKKKLIIIKNGNHSLSRKKDIKKICMELNKIIKNCS